MKIKRTVKEIEIEEIFCNKCGQSCRGANPFENFNGLIEAEILGGYDSTHIGDGDVYQFSLCEACLKILFGTFLYPALQGNYMTPDNYNPSFDRKKYWGEGVILFEDWTTEMKADFFQGLQDDSVLNRLNEVPREELIVWLYDLDNQDFLDDHDVKAVEAIKKNLKGRKDQ
jgi:hypothetical protein